MIHGSRYAMNGKSPLSREEINALLEGEIMGSGRDLVVTAYGHGNVIDKIAVSSFENSAGYGQGSDASTYCAMLNGLRQEENSWVFARVVPENNPVDLRFFLPVSFSVLILKLDDRSLQKVLREIDNQELAKALKGCGEDVLDKVFRNMSSRASKMMKEDMDYMGSIRMKDVEIAQNKIIFVIKHLEEIGEIIIARSEEEIH